MKMGIDRMERCVEGKSTKRLIELRREKRGLKSAL